jgi:hypothetical protein
LLCVLTTIKLDNQTSLCRAKVNNVRANWVLAPEFDPAKLSVA